MVAESNPDFSRNCSVLIEDNRLRANTYSILAALLSKPPTEDVIDYLIHIDSSSEQDDIGNMGKAWQELQNAASRSDHHALDTEYHHLFIGLGRGEVVPYGSWHITGFLMEKPFKRFTGRSQVTGH